MLISLVNKDSFRRKRIFRRRNIRGSFTRRNFSQETLSRGISTRRNFSRGNFLRGSHPDTQKSLLLLIFFFFVGYHLHPYLIQKRVSLRALCFSITYHQLYCWMLYLYFTYLFHLYLFYLKIYVLFYIFIFLIVDTFLLVSFLSKYLITFCSFWCTLFRNFHFLFRIEEILLEKEIFLNLFRKKVFFCPTLFCHFLLRFKCFNDSKSLGDIPSNFILVTCVHGMYLEIYFQS